MANRLIATWAAGGLVVGAVATGIVVATDAGETDLRRLPIGAAAGPTGGVATAGARDAATAEGSSSTKIAAGSDAMIEPGFARMYRTEFEVSGDLPALDGDAPVWQLRRSPVKSSQVSDLAAVFALSGDPVKAPDHDAWLVGPNDGTKPMLSVDGGAGHRWYFSDPGAFPIYAECAVAEPATVTTSSDAATEDKPADGARVSDPMPVMDCPTPEPPANLPGRDQALALAKDMATKVGLESADLTWETFGDEWSSGATAQLVLDGVTTEEPWLQVSFGGDAKVQWASGLLDIPTKAGDYPRVGTSAALEKLRTMSSGIGDKGVMPLAADAVAAEEDAPEQSTAPGAASDAPMTTECGPAVDCPPVGDPEAPVEEVVQIVKLTGVSAALSSYYGSDEVLYLVPSYRFTADDGSIWPVIALDDKYLAADSAAPNEDNTGGGSSSGSSGVAVTGGAPAPRVATEPETSAAK
ncbi:MAG: hypothetical protein AB7V43_03535 [Acidimicrobiia bacterium]